jgi:hypothetical protein
VLILGVLLTATFFVSRSCGSSNNDISQQQAVDIAIENASFVPCEATVCRQVRFLQQGVPPTGYWGVVLSEEVDAQGKPNRTESFLVNATSGAVTKR